MRAPGSTTIGVALLLAAVFASTHWQPADRGPDVAASIHRPTDSFSVDTRDEAGRSSLRLSADRLRYVALRDGTVTDRIEATLDAATAHTLWARIDEVRLEALAAGDTTAPDSGSSDRLHGVQVVATRGGVEQRLDLAADPELLAALCDDLVTEVRRLGTPARPAGDLAGEGDLEALTRRSAW